MNLQALDLTIVAAYAVFLLGIAVGMLISAVQGSEDHPDAIDYQDVDTRTTTGFNISALAVVLMLIGLYATWW